MNKETKEAIELAAKEMGEDSVTTDAYRFLLYSAHLGPDREAIVRETGIDDSKAKQMEDAAIKNRIWEDGKVHCDWLNEDEAVAATALRLDALALLGLVKRVS